MTSVGRRPATQASGESERLSRVLRCRRRVCKEEGRRVAEAKKESAQATRASLRKAAPARVETRCRSPSPPEMAHIDEYDDLHVVGVDVSRVVPLHVPPVLKVLAPALVVALPDEKRRRDLRASRLQEVACMAVRHGDAARCRARQRGAPAGERRPRVRAQDIQAQPTKIGSLGCLCDLERRQVRWMPH